jgi:DNA-binding GntR family transcriptional regulator
VPGHSERPVLDDDGSTLAPGRARRREDAPALGSHDDAAEPRGPGPYGYGPRRDPGWSGEGGAAGSRERPRLASGVLADRMAAALVHHEPGWRLPRHSALARRYNVSTAEIDTAMTELAARHLIRRLPDGQAYRASPAEFLILLQGLPGLTAHLDPMGSEVCCRSRQVSLRRVPEDIGWALRVSPADPVCVIRFMWTSDGQPAAFATTYLTRDAAGPYLSEDAGSAFAPLPVTPIDAERAGQPPAGQPGALYLEMQPPPPSVARSLRMSPGQLAALLTVRFDDPANRDPVALTIAVCRPDLFRIVVDSAQQPLPEGDQGGFGEAWTHAVGDWEP